MLYEGDDTAHPVGGCVMGDNPDSSVVDGYGQTHEVSNLFLAGAAVFPTRLAK